MICGDNPRTRGCFFFKAQKTTEISWNLSRSLHSKDSSQPKFFRPQTFPSLFKLPLGMNLIVLDLKISLKNLATLEWAASIVAVPKKDGMLQISRDYKVIINPVMEINQHPLPHPEDLYQH